MDKNAQKRLKWIVVAVIIIAGGLLALPFAHKGEPVLTSTARTADIRAWVEERARTSLPRIHKLTMPVDGRVLPIELEAGFPVQRGQIVASLDTAPLLAAEARARTELDMNRFNELEKTAAIEFQRWIEALGKTAEAARIMTEASDAHLEFSEWYTGSVEELVKTGVSPKERILRARADNAQYRVNAAVSRLVAEAMNTMHIASELGPKYVAQWLKRKSLQTDALELALVKAENDLRRAKITAPVDGVVLARHVRNETVLPAGAPLLDIGNLEDMEVTADILTQNAGRIRAGQDVDILGMDPAGGSVPGAVIRVKPEAFTKISSLGVEQQRVPVTIAFRENAGKTSSIGLGYRLRVRIYTDEAKGAVTVPRLAVFRDAQGRWRLFAVRDGRAALRQVEVGLMNDDLAQISQGLEAGERVIVSPPPHLRDGDKVHPQEA